MPPSDRASGAALLGFAVSFLFRLVFWCVGVPALVIAVLFLWLLLIALFMMVVGA